MKRYHVTDMNQLSVVRHTVIRIAGGGSTGIESATVGSAGAEKPTKLRWAPS